MVTMDNIGKMIYKDRVLRVTDPKSSMILLNNVRFFLCVCTMCVKMTVELLDSEFPGAYCSNSAGLLPASGVWLHV